MKILLAVDGSALATRAARFAVRLSRHCGGKARIEVFHADPPLLRSVAVKLGAAAVREYHADNGEAAVKDARAVLARARVPFTTRVEIAKPADAIAHRATRGRFDLIVMGARSVLGGLLLGAVATRVMSRTAIPVTLVR